MKTKKNLKRTAAKTFQMMVIIATLMLNVYCSKSDDGSNISIEAKTQTFSLNGINNCNTPSGNGSTFVMKIPYSTATGTTISKLHIKTVVSDGDNKTSVNTLFTDENNTITWVSCFRFGSQDWVEFEVVLEAEDGSKSNPSKVKINKPNEAN